MVDAIDHGRRPVSGPALADGQEETDPIGACPGIRLEHDFDSADPGLNQELRDGWGPVYGVWEGYASDEKIRWAGSSGGAATALSLYCLESLGMRGVLHTAARADAPYLNHTVFSTNRKELAERTGSRYAPASPCDGLEQIERATGPCVFIGKPCDVAALSMARRLRPSLDEKVGLAIAFFCAGTPSTRGTLELLRSVGVSDVGAIESVRYRGNGWPGRWTVRYRTESGAKEVSLTYAESWAFLQKYRQWRCYICPDHTGEFADVSVGDPWYRPIDSGDPGRSLIVARTRRGVEYVRRAEEQGFLVLEQSGPHLLPASQPNLLDSRARLWGQLLTLRMLGVAVPKFRGFPMFALWLRRLSVVAKIRSVTGTAKRVITKRLRVPIEYAAPAAAVPGEGPR